MVREGTVVNGVIVPDKGEAFPEGARVRIELATEEDFQDIPVPTGEFEYPHPLAPYDREKEIELLRQSIAEMEAGEPGIPLDEAMDRIAAELNLPRIPRE